MEHHDIDLFYVCFCQVSMVDISEKIGRASCSELQNDFPAKDVMFLVADVTKREQLVKCVCSFVDLPPNVSFDHR